MELSRCIESFQGRATKILGASPRVAGGVRGEAERDGGGLLHGRYRLLDVIHRGAMGCVYKALDTRSGAVRAIKELSCRQAEGDRAEHALKRFREEARILKSLDCPGVPKVFDDFCAHGGHYIVMSFIDGTDLERLMKENGNRPFPEEKVLAWAGEILRILDFLHSRRPPVVYRDVKPSNIMLDDCGRLYLVDFGIARLYEEHRKGTMIGTPGFAAPEQYRGYTEPRSDLYALGATMHCLLTGVDPSSSSIPAFHFDDPRNLNASVSRRTSRLVMSMVDVVVEGRPRSARAVLELLAPGRPEVRTVSLPRRPSPRAESGRMGLCGVAALALLVFSLLYLVMGRDDLSAPPGRAGPAGGAARAAGRAVSTGGVRHAAAGSLPGKSVGVAQRHCAGRLAKRCALIRRGDPKGRVRELLGPPPAKTFPRALLSFGSFRVHAGFPRGEMWRYGRLSVEFDECGRVTRAGAVASRP